VTINDAAENDRVFSLMVENLGVQAIWIGLTDEPHKNYYEKWAVTDELVTYTNWENGEPNAVSGYNFECITLYRTFGKWNDDRCDRPRNFVCEKPKQPVNHIDTDYEGCNHGWILHDKRCYKFEQDPQDRSII